MAQSYPLSPAEGGNETQYWAAVIADAKDTGRTELKLVSKGLTYVPTEIGELTLITKV